MTRPVHGGEVWDYGRDLIDFSANINPLGPSPKALEVLESWKIGIYPPADQVNLKEEVARYLGVGLNEVVLGNGSMELIKDFCSLYLSKSDSVLIASPTFSEYERYSSIYGGSVDLLIPERRFDLSVQEFINRLSKDTKAVFICRPNNPTGSALSENDLVEIITSAGEQGTLVFLDEAFIEFSGLASYASGVREFENLFVLGSFTKFFALPGLRLGYGVANPSMIARFEEVRPPWNINIFAHDAAIASIKDKKYIKRTRELITCERKFLAEKIRELGVKVYESMANFLLLQHDWNSREVKKELLKEDLLVRDCSDFHGLDTRFIRISVRDRKDNEKLIAALKKQVRSGEKKGRECPYYPCHFEGQDCTYCFCPFYPCGDEKRGKLIIGKRGNEVWSCKDCKDIHRPEVVAKIKSLLGDKEIESLEVKKRLEIKEAVMPSS